LKRIFRMGIIALFLLTACTAEKNNNEKPASTPPTETIQNETNTNPKPNLQNQTEQGTDNELANAKEAMAFLKKAEEITSNLKTVSFLSLVYNTSYLNDLNEPEHSYFNAYNSTYEGTLQRDPKLAYIIKSIDMSSGTLSEGDYLHDESTRITYTNTEYFDSELGWFTVSGDYSYGGVAEIDEQPYISHDELDSSFKTLEHIDAFMQLFMSYPNQLSIAKDKIEDFNGDIELDNWIIELQLTNEQYLEHFNMLEFNLFTGSYLNVDSNELHYVELEDLRDLHLSLTFDPSYNLVQLMVFHTYNGLEDYVDADVNRNDYFTTQYFTFFSDYNAPYTHSIPEEVPLNADYN
jgi:hypothetical protein